MIWLSLFVWGSIGRLALGLAAKERNEVGEVAVGDSVSSSSSSESMGLNIGEAGWRFEIRSSLMLRCLRMGLQGRGLRVGVGEQRSSGTCADPSMLPGTDGVLGGGGVQSTAVCRGPYSHVTSESFNLFKR